MSNNGGFTCIPQIYTDAEGVEHLSYNHAHVVDHGKRLEVQADALEDQSEYFSVDNAGNVEHEWDFEGTDEVVDYIHSDEDDDDEYYDEDDDFNLAEYIYSELVPEEDYDELLEFAGDNLSQEYCDWFDEVIEEGDIVAIEAALDDLIEAYNDSIDFQ